MSIRSKAWNWNATDADCWGSYPCDRHIHASSYREVMRAVDIQAPVEVVYRWICQIKVAPYSYDWLDNLGRRSPRGLTPGAERVEIGQNFMIGPIVEFEKDRHITAITDPRAARVFGACAFTYMVKPSGPGSCRLVVKGNLERRGWWGQAPLFLLAWGDFVMMRKQLLTLKALAERTVGETDAEGLVEAAG
jgi:hypothetical protein